MQLEAEKSGFLNFVTITSSGTNKQIYSCLMIVYFVMKLGVATLKYLFDCSTTDYCLEALCPPGMLSTFSKWLALQYFCCDNLDMRVDEPAPYMHAAVLFTHEH